MGSVFNSPVVDDPSTYDVPVWDAKINQWVPHNSGYANPQQAQMPLHPNQDDEWTYPAAPGVFWTFKYDALNATWNCTGGAPLVVVSGGGGLTTAAGTAYIASGSSMVAPLTGDYTVVGNCHLYFNGSGSSADSRMTTFVNGAASGPETGVIGSSGSDAGMSLATDPLGITAGQTIELRYKSTVASASIIFSSFRIEVIPRRVH